jgi:hypothetical protein
MAVHNSLTAPSRCRFGYKGSINYGQILIFSNLLYENNRRHQKFREAVLKSPFLIDDIRIYIEAGNQIR